MSGNGGYFTFNGTISSDGRTGGNVIPSGTGFMVKANSPAPSLTIMESAKTNFSYSTANLREEKLANVLYIKIEDGKNEDYTAIQFLESASDSYEIANDGHKLLNDQLNIASIIPTIGNFSNNTLSYPHAGKVIPLYFSTKNVGVLSLKVKNLSSINFDSKYFSLINSLMTP